MMFNGYRVLTTSPTPKLKIKSEFEWITDEGRESINDYLLQTFGSTDLIPNGDVVVDKVARVIMANAATVKVMAAKLKEIGHERTIF